MDPALRRFSTEDPMAEKYYSISPYAYCANNPILFIDPDGMQLKGVSKDDANKMHEDINTVFADDNKKYLSTDYVKKEKVKSEFLSKDVKLLDFEVRK